MDTPEPGETSWLHTLFTQHRSKILIGAGGILVLALIIVLATRFWPGELSDEDIARVEETCRGPKQQALSELEQQVALTATDGEAFVRGLEQLPWLVAILSQRSTAYEDAQATPPSTLAANAKADALKRLDLSLELVRCYEGQLNRFPKAREAVASAVVDLQAERENVAAADFAQFFATGEPAESVIELAPREQRRLRLRTLCIDRFAPPPEAGTRYILGGTVDETKRRSLCDLLRSAQGGGSLASAQNAIWKLEQEHMDLSTPPVEAAAGATGMVSAQREGSLHVSAKATGALTALDVTLTNATDAPLSIDTSCAYFVPLSIPDLTQPLPTAPPDWSDPATLEKFTEDSNRQLLQTLDEQEKTFEKLGMPFPPQLKTQQEELRKKLGEAGTGEVKGIYSRVYLPGNPDADPDSLDPFQVVQTGLGRQPLGVVGALRGGPPPGRREIDRIKDALERMAEAPERARENLDRALDDYARDPSRQHTEDVLDALERCFVNACVPSSEMIRLWEQIRTRSDQMVDQAINRVIASVTEQTLLDAVDAIRFCQAVGCNVENDVRQLDTHLRNLLRNQVRDR